MAFDLQAERKNAELSLNSHRGVEQLDITCVLDQLERNGVDVMFANASGEHPGLFPVWRCGFASGILGEQQRTTCLLLCGTSYQFYSQRLRRSSNASQV